MSFGGSLQFILPGLLLLCREFQKSLIYIFAFYLYICNIYFYGSRGGGINLEGSIYLTMIAKSFCSLHFEYLRSLSSVFIHTMYYYTCIVLKILSISFPCMPFSSVEQYITGCINILQLYCRLYFILSLSFVFYDCNSFYEVGCT